MTNWHWFVFGRQHKRELRQIWFVLYTTICFVCSSAAEDNVYFQKKNDIIAMIIVCWNFKSW